MNNSLYLVLAFIFGLHFNTNAQSSHDHFEEISKGYTVSRLWKDLKFENESQFIKNQAEIEFQAFLWEHKQQALNGKGISSVDFSLEYAEFISLLKKKYEEWVLTDKKKDKKIITKAANGPCTNIDFEDGNLLGWTLTRGETDGSAPYSFVNQTATGPNPHHQIIGNGVDPVTGIPTNNPQGGAFSVRLGDGTGIGAQAARMTQTFLVDSTNFLFTYSYAVIFETPTSHNDNELPYFTVRVFDSLGNSVPCGEYSAVANSITAASYSSTVYNGTTVLYKNWESVFTNLSAYIGQNIRVEFTSGDCSLTGHYGYCYLDAFCGTAELSASNNLICTGDSSLLTAPPGAGSYLWSNGSTSQSTYVYSGGTYSCEITPFQGSGCSVTLSISIDETPSPFAAISASDLQICVFDSIQFTNTSSIPSPGIIQSYTWNYGDGTTTLPGLGTITGVPNTNGNYLSNQHIYSTSGQFTVQLTVISQDGCVDSVDLVLTINAQPAVTAGPNHIICDGETVILSGSGAATYTWDQGIQNGVSFIPSVGNHNYQVIGTDQNGCSDTASANVQVNPNPTLDAGADQNICEGDSTMVSAITTGNITWSNGIMNGNYFTPNLGTVTYYVDAEENGCISTDSLSITVNPLVTLFAGNDTIICSNGTAILQASITNGSSFFWFNSQGTFSNPSNLATSYIPSSTEIIQGFSWIYFTGNSPYGCPSITDSLQIEINHFSNSYTLQITDVTCFGYNDGTANLTMISPNNTPFTYALNGTNPTPSSSFNNLAPGPYFIQVANPIGCDTLIYFNIVEPPLLEVQIIQVVDVVCNGADNGWMESNAIGGNGGYTYGWSNDPTLSSPLNDTLAPGNYTAFAWDQNACTAQTDTIIIEPQPLANQFVFNPILCFGDSTLLASVPSGGIAPYTYLWENQVIDSSRNTYAGTYDLVVTDANGCFVFDTVVLSQPSQLQAQISEDTIVCSNSLINLVYSASGGSFPYSYNWSTSTVDNDTLHYLALNPQFVTCVLTDANGCQISDSAQVDIYSVQPSDFGLQTSKDNICVGDSADLMYSYLNIVPLLSVFWNDCINCNFPRMVHLVSDTSFSASLVTICYDTIVHTIPLNVIEIPDLSFDLNGGEICPNTGFQLQANGVSSNEWDLYWDLGNGTHSTEYQPWISYSTSGTYLVTLTINDTNGCRYSSITNDTIHVLPLPIANFEVNPSVKNFLDPSFTFTNTSLMATSYIWNFGDNVTSNQVHEEHTYLSHGEFYVELIALNDLGCSDTLEKLIRVNPDWVIYIPNAFTPDADRFNPTFFVEGIGISEHDFELLIFNRWGEIIFETHDLHGEWDGTYLGQIVQDGTYPWKVNFKDLTGERHLKIGHVAVLK